MLDCKTIGGTWVTATSRHMKGTHDFTSEVAKEVTFDIVEDIRQEDNLIANYVAMFFDDMAKQLTTMKASLNKGCKLAYVFGNSRCKGWVVETDSLLLDLMDGLGFSAEGIEEIRRRNSGKMLRESVVYCSKT